MKKLLLIGLIGAFVFVACNKDENVDSNYRDLGHSVQNLKISIPEKTSVFDDFTAYLSLPMGQTLKDSETGLDIKIELQDVKCHRKIDNLSSEEVSGAYELTSDTSVVFKPSSDIILNETYVLTLRFIWKKKVDGSWKTITDGKEGFYRSLWTEYVPTVVDGKDIIFGTTRGGDNNTDIVVYDGDMKIDFLSKLILADDTVVENSSDKVALRLRSLDITSNKGGDYAVWEMDFDTMNTSVQYTPILPDGKVHLIPNIYYTVNVKLDYMVNKGGKWDFITTANGDTITWNYNKTFATSDLFVPRQIITDVYPSGGRVSIDSLIYLNMSSTHLKEEEYNDIMFRPRLDMFSLFKDEKQVPTTFSWLEKGVFSWATSDSSDAVLEPIGSYLIPDGTYKVEASAYWEFKVDSVWHTMTLNDELYAEKVGVSAKAILGTPGNFIKTYYPEADTEEVGLTEDFSVDFNYVENTEITVKNIVFRPVLDTFYISSGVTADTLVIHNYSYENSKQVVLKQPNIYYPSSDYKLNVASHWEYKEKNGEFVSYNSDGDTKSVIESVVSSFKTTRAPSTIYGDVNVPRSNSPINLYPVVSLDAAKGSITVTDGVEFMAVVEEVYVAKKVNGENIMIPHQVNWLSDSEVELTPDSYYGLDSTYSVNFIAHWEFRKEGTVDWLKHPNNLNASHEKIRPTFKTAGVPNTIINLLTPAHESMDIALDSLITLRLNVPEGKVVDHGGTSFKVVRDSFVVRNGEVVSFTETVKEDGELIEFVPNTSYKADTTYTISTAFHWEYMDKASDWIKVDPEALVQKFDTKAEE